MQWTNCYSALRTGYSPSKEIPRTDYQRDYDRLIFASSFRRLQNKTQVFPLPGSTFVHNRLTHSLEVASVGRTLGKIIGDHLATHDVPLDDELSQQFYKYDLANVIGSACLAHDIGNPAFGHSGEKAISNYFLENQEAVIEGATLRSYFSDKEWTDLITFEGNANAIRILTHQYRGKAVGGMRLTYSTLASILKYPCEASAIDKRYNHRKKYGFFIPETDTVQSIAEVLHMHRDPNEFISYKRHPYVYLVEAADDICYRIIDVEDAHRLGIVTKEQISGLFLNLIKEIGRKEDVMERIQQTYQSIPDDNDSIAYLRAKTINALANTCAEIFIHQKEYILNGEYMNTLVDEIEERCPTLKEIMKLSIKKIYNHSSVVEIEIAGFHVMSHLLDMFVPAVLRNKKLPKDKMTLTLIPHQFTEHEQTDSPYLKALSVVDYISGMTDAYATEYFRKTTGIDISKHQ